ncbi:hypothetical protein FVER14953_10575 [Fusarium verticillioides]|nr:hypothetical protein FVER14953_10575 [Fusarium verticillioides]
MSSPKVRSTGPAPFFVRTIYPFDPPAPASFENLLAFDKGELGLIHHVESSGWTECSLLKCGTVGWMPLNYCNVFDPKPLRPLLKAVIKFSEALGLDPDVPIDGGDIDAIVHEVSSIMNLGYRLDVDCPQIGAWKVLHPISICVHDLVLVLQKQLGTMREGTPGQGKKDSTHRTGIVSIAFKIVIKADTFLSAVKKLHKSHVSRGSTNAKTPSIVDDESKTSSTTTAVDASNDEPDSPLSRGPNKHEHMAYLAPASPRESPERESSPQTKQRQDHHPDLQDSGSKTQLEQQLLHRPDDILPQPLGHHTFVQNQSFILRAQVTRCSLPALMGHLTDCELQSIREQFVEAFFLTWELFCTPEELLSALTKRFKAAQNEEAQRRNRIQSRVCYALRVWLESHWEPSTDQRVLLSLDSFLRCEVQNILPASSAFLLDITKSIGIAQQDRPCISPSIPTIKRDTTCRHGRNMSMDIANSLFTCRGDQVSIVYMCHDSLAAQITSKQMQVFSCIKARELLAGRWMVHNSKDAPNVVAMCQLTNRISNWVKESILTEAEPKGRGYVIETWILIAQHLFQLRNFDGLVAVTSGLDDTSVLRLKQSWDSISIQAKESFRSLRRIVDPSENRKKLRALFSSSSAPRLPFLGSYLSQLVFTDEYHKVKNVKEGEASSGSDEKIINWEKYARIASIVKGLVGSQQPFDIIPDIELQMWIGKRTSEFWCVDQNCLQEIYYKRSKFLESGMSHHKRYPSLRSLFHLKS